MSGSRAVGVCPECGAEIELDNPMEGEIVDCPECYEELEIANLSPLVLEVTPEQPYGLEGGQK